MRNSLCDISAEVSIPCSESGFVGWVCIMTLTSIPDLLELRAVTDREWQVFDVRTAPGDGRTEIARIERVHDYVLVTWVSPTRGWAAFPNFEGALRALRLTCAARPLVAA
jgi:hypothetical protein